MQKAYLALALAATVALAACGSDKTPTSNPAAPSTAVPSGSNAGADGSTLKASAPVLVSPVGGERVADRKPTLTFRASTGTFVQATFSYRVQLINAANTTIQDTVVTGLSLVVKNDLDTDKDYKWRVRAEMNGAVGPWSTVAAFKSPEKAVGYITANEIYDPLTDGVSVGTIHGAHTFIPGVGIRLEEFTSYIEYKLAQPLTAGEYSAIMTNLSTDGRGIKTKVMGMSEGLSDIVTNSHRMTCEKRNDGTVAWRFITSDEQIDTEGAERVKVDFHESWTYFWRATWGSAFNLQIRVDNSEGPVIYNFGKGYRGEYNPDPHYVFAGVPIGRTGLDGGTPPGMIVRQIWVSGRPRPSFANQ